MLPKDLKKYMLYNHRISIVAVPICKIIIRTLKPKSDKHRKNVDTIGDHIRNRRLELGLQLKGVALSLSISESTLISWEHNIKIPRVNKYPKIFDFLGYTILEKNKGCYSNLFRNYRKSKGITQDEFSREINIDQKRIHKIEFARTQLSEKIQNKIKDFFGLKI